MKHLLTLCAVATIVLAVGSIVQGELLRVDNGTGVVVSDSETGLVWYADLSHFTVKSYEQQLGQIDNLNTDGDGYFGVTDWHMASLAEMQGLWSYPDNEIRDSFYPSDVPVSAPNMRLWWGRYEWTGGYIGSHFRARLQWNRKTPLGLESDLIIDNSTWTQMGAWVVSTYATVPPPSNASPVAVCQDVRLVLGENGEATLTASQVDGGCSDPDGDPIVLSIDKTAFTCGDVGDNIVTLTVTDDKGASASCQAKVTVVDQTPPAVELNQLTDALWPANHKLAKVADISAMDKCDAQPELIVEITSNEPINGSGDGDTDRDWVWDADTGELFLRAERSGSGNDRVYTITVMATDDSGNTTTETATVTVPHNKGKGKKKWSRLTGPVPPMASRACCGRMTQSHSEGRPPQDLLSDG